MGNAGEIWRGLYRRLGVTVEARHKKIEHHGDGDHPPPPKHPPPPTPPPHHLGPVFFRPTVSPDRAALTDHGWSVLQDAAAHVRGFPYGARVVIFAGAGDRMRLEQALALAAARELVGRGVDPGCIVIDVDDEPRDAPSAPVDRGPVGIYGWMLWLVIHGDGNHPPPPSPFIVPRPPPPTMLESVEFTPSVSPDRTGLTDEGLAVLREAAAFARESRFGARVVVYAGPADLRGEAAKGAEDLATSLAWGLVSHGVNGGTIWTASGDKRPGTIEVLPLASSY